MAFCGKCGKEIDDEAVICVHCGCPTGVQAAPAAPTVDMVSTATTGEKVLSFLIPIAGIILYCVNKDKKPKAAKTCLLVGVITWAICIILILAIAIIPSKMTESQLKAANSNAKWVFTIVNNEAADLLVNGVSVEPGYHEFKLSNYNKDVKLETAVYKALKDQGTDSYITFEIDKFGNAKSATWRSSSGSSIYGQWPNPIHM